MLSTLFLEKKKTTFLETGDGLEGYVQLAGTGSWVLTRRGRETKMVRLPAFPRVDKTARHFVVSATEGVETVVGPSVLAPPTGQLLPLGAEARSEMVWSVESGWPADSGRGSTGERKFVLLEGVGWVQLDEDSGAGGSRLREVGSDDSPSPPPSAADGSLGGGREEYQQQNGGSAR